MHRTSDSNSKDYATITVRIAGSIITSSQGYCVIPNLRQDSRAESLMAEFREYRIVDCKVTLVPIYDQYPNGAGGLTTNTSLPELYWASMSEPIIPSKINKDLMLNMNARPVKFDRKIVRHVPCRVPQPVFGYAAGTNPSSVTPADVGATSYRLGKSSPWIQTLYTASQGGLDDSAGLNTVNHFGAVFYLSQQSTSEDGAGPIVGRSEVEFKVQYRKPVFTDAEPTSSAITVDIVTNAPLAAPH